MIFISLLKTVSCFTGENAAIGATQDASVHVDPRNGQSTSSDSKSQPNNRVFICINSSQETGPHQELTYIQAYMKFMYWTCVSPFNPMKNEEGAAATNMVDRMLNYLQKVSQINLLFSVKCKHGL